MRAFLSAIAFVICTGVLFACAEEPVRAESKNTTAQQQPQLVISSEFRTRWWSPAQIADFDPNAPPTKESVVVIAKWEHTDPVGVPHPDVVSWHVSIALDKHEEGSAPSTLDGAVTLKACEEWRVGDLVEIDPFAEDAVPNLIPAKLDVVKGPCHPVESLNWASVRNGETLEIEVNDIEIAPQINKHFGEGRWPYELRMLLLDTSSGEARHQGVFPLMPSV